ncbi:hypothetical protein CYMTET_11482 [Cymbomonas tetramitiformis]|uniref:Uncharacterized protein n=1 Tax=Cymbomonas tetramitiformis TaxID=36881 RepID=A0AAE0GM73_9CHLO|nr:hypothetical protein CYMTET_11482 [Cymbomonas tetramitiformis]
MSTATPTPTSTPAPTPALSPISRPVRLETIFTKDPWAHYSSTPATPAATGVSAAARRAVKLLRKESFEAKTAKNVLSAVFGSKDVKFTGTETHADLKWLHLVGGIEKHFVNENDDFAGLLELTDSTVECIEDANALLFVPLEHLLKPTSSTRAWLDAFGRDYPKDGKRALLEPDVDPDDGIRIFNEYTADASYKLGVPLKPDVIKKHFLSSLDKDFYSALRSEYPRVDQLAAVDIMDLQSRLREEYKEITKGDSTTKRTAMKPSTLSTLITRTYDECAQPRDERDCGISALHSLVEALNKELASLRSEVHSAKIGQGERGGQGDHDRRPYFERKFIDTPRHDRGGARGKGKKGGKSQFYRVGASSDVKTAFHVASHTFVPACTMPRCEGCHHSTGDRPTLSLHKYNADDENVKAAHLAEKIAEEMQRAYDAEDDDAFDEIYGDYGQASVNKGPTASTFNDEERTSLRAQYSGLSALHMGSFVTAEEPQSAALVVLDEGVSDAVQDSWDRTYVPCTVVKTNIRKPAVSVVHNDTGGARGFAD